MKSPTARVAIVTTLREVPPKMLASFLAWHMRIGFHRIYLYFDDPHDTGIAQARKLRRSYPEGALAVVPCDGTVRQEWNSLQTAERWDIPSVEHHVEVRQLLNTEHALRRAHAEGDVDWLLHIDSDELFHIDDCDAAGHFGRLSLHGCVNFRYPIHEGCPEEVDTDNVFQSVTLFRRHPECLEAAVKTAVQASDSAETAYAAARTAHAFWRQSGRNFFLGSLQGKSATRVIAGARPMSVHAFYPPSAADITRCWAGFRDGQDAVACSLKVVSPSRNPCILHYISCDFRFWLRKYQLLGQFTHKPGGWAAGGELPPDAFHVQSRDLVAAVDEATARERYETAVCLRDAEEAARQVASAVCFRCTLVRDQLVQSSCT